MASTAVSYQPINRGMRLSSRDTSITSPADQVSHLYHLIRYKQITKATKFLRKISSATNTSSLPINEEILNETVLHLLARTCNEILLETLLTSFKGQVNVNAKDSVSGATPLHLACAEGNSRIVYLLLKNGAQANVTCDRQKQTPAHFAAECGSVPCLRLLKKFLGKLDEKNSFGNRPLHRAAYHNHHKVVTFLLEEASANVNTLNKDGQSPLYMAIMHGGGMESVVTLVSKFKANLNDKLSQNYDRSLLHIAIHEKKEAIAQYLVHQGADVNCIDSQGRTPLHDAVESGNLDLSRFLLKYGSQVDPRTNIELYTPLHLSAIQGNCQLMKELLSNGASINALTVRNRTPLHYACEKNHTSCARLLLESKAKRFIYDTDNHYPIDLAKGSAMKKVFSEKMRWPSHLTVDIPATQKQRVLRDASPSVEMNLFPKTMMKLQKKLLEQNNKKTSQAAPSSPLASHGGKRKKKQKAILSSALSSSPFGTPEKASKRSKTVSGQIALKKHRANKEDSLQQLQQLITMQQNLNPNVDLNYYNDYLKQLQEESERSIQKEETSKLKQKSKNWDPYFAFNKSPLTTKTKSAKHASLTRTSSSSSLTKHNSAGRMTLKRTSSTSSITRHKRRSLR